MRIFSLTKFDFAAGSQTSTVTRLDSTGTRMLPNSLCAATGVPPGTVYADVESFAFGGFYAPAEFNNDILTFRSFVDGTAYVKLTKTAVTGWNFFTSDELVQIASSGNLSISTNTNTAAAASILLELKS